MHTPEELKQNCMEYNRDLGEYTVQLEKAQCELKQLPNGEQKQSKIKQVEMLQRNIQLMEGVIRTANKSKEILQQSAGVSDPAGVCLLSVTLSVTYSI